MLAQVGRDAAHLVLSRPLSGGIGAGANDWSAAGPVLSRLMTDKMEDLGLV